MNPPPRVLVYGATGHTGRFVLDELLRRGLEPALAGRSSERLASGPSRHAHLERHVVGVEDSTELSHALSGVDVLVNCAGPFLDTALPLARAAIDAGVHYLDVTAEQAAVAEVYRRLDAPARAAGVTVVPAMAFFGGLADLLVTAALDGDTDAGAVDVAIGLDRWWPTEGTRLTGARNTAARQVISGGVLAPLATPAPSGRWTYPDPLGEQPVTPLPLSEVMTIHRHLDVQELRSFLNTTALEELRADATPAPVAEDEYGRSTQQFVMEVVVHRGTHSRRLSATGRDIYAVTAPILVEGVVRLFDGRHRGPGALAPGEAFDAADVLDALQRHVDGFGVG